MIQIKINNLVSIPIFLLCNKMLSGHNKMKMFLEMKFQDKTKYKRCIKMTVGHGRSLRSVYGKFSLRMRSSQAYFRNDNSLIMGRELTSIN